MKETQKLLTGIQNLVGSKPPEVCLILTGPGASYTHSLSTSPRTTHCCKLVLLERVPITPREGTSVKA